MVKHEIEKLIIEWKYELEHDSSSQVRKNTIKGILNDLENLLDMVKCEESDTLKISLKPLKNIGGFRSEVNDLVGRFLRS